MTTRFSGNVSTSSVEDKNGNDVATLQASKDFKLALDVAGELDIKSGDHIVKIANEDPTLQNGFRTMHLNTNETLIDADNDDQVDDRVFIKNGQTYAVLNRDNNPNVIQRIMAKLLN